MLKNVTVAMSRHTEEAIVRSDGICPLVQDSTNHVKAQRWQKGDFDHTQPAGKAMPHARWMCKFGLIYDNNLILP